MTGRTRHPQLVAWSCRVYALMLWTYPAALRRDFGRELRLTFKSQTEDAFNSGSLVSIVGFALRIAADWLRTVATEVEEPVTSLSLLGLGAREGEACGCLDRSTFTVGLLLATLGVVLLIFGWYEWLSYKSLFLSHHRPI